MVGGVDVCITDGQDVGSDRQRFTLRRCKRHLALDDGRVILVDRVAHAVAAIGFEMEQLPWCQRAPARICRVAKLGLRRCEHAPGSIVIEQGVFVAQFADLWVHGVAENLDGRTPPGAGCIGSRAIALVLPVYVFPGQVPGRITIIPQVYGALPQGRETVVHAIRMIAVIQLLLRMTTLVNYLRDIA